MSSDAKARDDMNRMYRWTRYVYDVSRKYYLLGRDVLISALEPKAGQHICEVGCGTARNLRKLAALYPETHFYGIDASDEMLKTARRSLAHNGLNNKVPVMQGFSQNFDPATLFDLEKPLDKIIFSYALSIIPPWQASIDHAIDILPLGGEIHIVDFGGQDDLPRWFRGFLFWWLKMFHVYHRPEVLEYMKQLAAEQKGTLDIQNLYKGYAYRVVFTKA